MTASLCRADELQSLFLFARQAAARADMLRGNTPARRSDDAIEAAPVQRGSANVFHPRLPNPDMPPRVNQHGPLFVPPSAGFDWPPRSHSSPRKPPMMSDGPVQKLHPRPVRPAEGRPVMLRGGGPKRRDELAVQHAVDCQRGLTRPSPVRPRTFCPGAGEPHYCLPSGNFVTSFARGAPVSRRRDQGPRIIRGEMLTQADCICSDEGGAESSVYHIVHSIDIEMEASSKIDKVEHLQPVLDR
jgi:hypothetical protein